jgi:hypothetical protein
MAVHPLPPGHDGASQVWGASLRMTRSTSFRPSPWPTSPASRRRVESPLTIGICLPVEQDADVNGFDDKRKIGAKSAIRIGAQNTAKL